MGKESTQKQLSRVRPPRVQITYDVDIGGASESKELPFVLGVMGDYTGHPENAPVKLKERKFVDIDRDNFDHVMKSMAPRLQLRVENRLSRDGSDLGVELRIDSLKDFEPGKLTQQVAPLKKLIDVRNRLADLRNKVIGNDRLEELLDEIVRDTEKLRRLGNPDQSTGG